MRYVMLTVMLLTINSCTCLKQDDPYAGFDKYTYAKILLLQQRADALHETRLGYIEASSREINSNYNPFIQTISIYCTTLDIGLGVAGEIDIDFNNDGAKEKVVMFFKEDTDPGDSIEMDWLTSNNGLECFAFVVFAGTEDLHAPIFFHWFYDDLSNYDDPSIPTPVKLTKQQNSTYRLVYTLNNKKYECGWFIEKEKGYWDGICINDHNKQLLYTNCFIKFHKPIK